MKFLIQTIDGHVKHDFSFTLLEAIEYHNWYNNSDEFTYILSENINLEAYIPIGTVEFVSNYIKKWFNKEIKPINIPQILNTKKYTKRDIIELDINNDLTYLGKRFVKSNDKIKGFTDIVDLNTVKLEEGNYLISEIIDIHSEWRAFIYRDNLIGLQNYSGDFTIFPDVKLIEEMIGEYKTSPKAYTLDVGINQNGTFIIECHTFISCGLYGFADLKNIPLMFRDAFNEVIK